MICFIIGFVIGFTFGIFFSAFRIIGNLRKKIIGKLRIDRSDDDGPYCFLELRKGLETVENQKVVMLEVDTTSFVPHK